MRDGYKEIRAWKIGSATDVFLVGGGCGEVDCVANEEDAGGEEFDIRASVSEVICVSRDGHQTVMESRDG